MRRAATTSRLLSRASRCYSTSQGSYSNSNNNQGQQQQQQQQSQSKSQNPQQQQQQQGGQQNAATGSHESQKGVHQDAEGEAKIPKAAQEQKQEPTMRSLKGQKISNNEWKFKFEQPFKLHKFEQGPPMEITTNKEELIHFYRQMQRIRLTENASDSLYKKKQIRGFLHIYSGQEAVCIGMEAAITKEDHVITAYRDHGHAIGRGDTPKRIIAELLGKKAGCSEGKGGSMHMYSRELNFYGGNGIVGAQVPVGAGLAFAAKTLKTGKVAVASYGDGAANQGQVFEAFNMSYLLKLPVIYVCENNKYGMGTEAYRSSASTEYYKRGDYIPGIHVDGMDVLAVKAASKFAVEHARSGKGPVVMEMETYRYLGHSMSDPGTSYRTQDEVGAMRKSRDPISQVRERLLINDIATKEEILEINKQVKAEVDEAVQSATDGEFPPDGDLYTHIYVEEVPVRGVELSNSYTPGGAGSKANQKQ